MRHRYVCTMLTTLAALIAGGCGPSGPEATHVDLSTVEPLRAAFNADSGKVRAIFLASPT